MIFLDIVGISPSEYGIFTHRKCWSCDFNFLWATMQFFNGEIASKSKNITLTTMYFQCQKFGYCRICQNPLMFSYGDCAVRLVHDVLILATHFTKF